MAWTPRKLVWLACGAVVLGAAAPDLDAAVYITTKTADTADGECDRDCSLREAVVAANHAAGGDVIIVAPGTYRLTRAGADDETTGDLDVGDDLVVYGESAASTVVDGGGLDRLFDVPEGVAAELVGVTLRNGRASAGGGAVRNRGALRLTRCVVSDSQTFGAGAPGGGVWSAGAGSSLAIEQSTIANNVAAGVGGGVAVGESMTMVNSTVSGNQAPSASGGGVYAFDATEADITQATITGNHALQGGGIFGESVPFLSVDHPRLSGSILAGNTAAADRDCAGAVASLGDNLVGDGDECIDFAPGKGDLEGTGAAPLDARLAALANNGGSTPTHALLAGSPALDRFDGCEAVDQRGQGRPAGACDVGAFEVGNDCLTGGPTLCLNQDRFRLRARWRTPQGASGDAQAIPLTSDSGLFWFFDAANVELTAKVLDGCGANGRYWVFVSGLTNVEVTLTVTDTQHGTVKTYLNPLNRNFRPVLDTGAFATCP